MDKANNLPDFKIKEKDIPSIRVKSIHFEQFKVFDDYFIDFSDNNFIRDFACFVGPNGCGKTTILDSIQLIFSRFEGVDLKRLKAMLGKAVRHVDDKNNGVYGDDDFLITAKIACSLGDYEVKINKEGFILNHPEEVRMLVYRLCFYAKFDQDLKYFQLERNKWPLFRELFKSVTGFRAEEIEGVFDQSDDPIQAEMLSNKVLSFNVYKPDEIIRHTECSAGEKKIIKSFSTLLNKEYNPQVILIDNVAMHVESGRHMELIKSMKRCFPSSQIFATTHSHYISKSFRDKSSLYDLRLIKVSNLIKKEPWRLYLIDEIKDCIVKLESCEGTTKCKKLIKKGIKILEECKLSNKYLVRALVNTYINEVNEFFVDDVMNYYNK